MSRTSHRLIAAFATLVFFAGTAMAQEPRLAEADVAALADVKSRDAGYPLEAYTHGSPMYVRASGAWEVRYTARQDRQDRTGTFTVTVDDATGLISLTPSYAASAVSPTPAPVSPLARWSSVRVFLIALLVVLIFRFTAWFHRRASYARPTTKA